MITIKQNKNKIVIEGHALYDDYGKDIVCASVSSIVITTVNAIEKIDKNLVKHIYKDEILTITYDDKSHLAIKLIENMIDLLKELETNYKDNVRVL